MYMLRFVHFEGGWYRASKLGYLCHIVSVLFVLTITFTQTASNLFLCLWLLKKWFGSAILRVHYSEGMLFRVVVVLWYSL